MSIYEWLYNILIEGLKYIIIGHFFFGYVFNRKKSRFWLAVYPLLIPLVEWLGNENILYLYKNLWRVLILLFLLRGETLKKIKAFFVMNFMVAIVDTGIIVPLSLIWEINNEESKILLLVGSVGLLFWIMLVLIFKRELKYIQNFWKTLTNVEYVFLVIVLLVLSFILGGMQGYLYDAITMSEKMIIFSLGILGVALFVFVCFLLFWTTHSRKKLKELNRIGARYLELQRKYYEESLRQYEDMRSFRHDINHHIFVMSELSSGDKIEELKEYIRKMAESRKTSGGIHTGNFIADCIISYAIKDLQGEDFLFEIDGHFPELFLMEDMDFCILLSNLFENAKEALEKVDGKRMLQLEIKRYEKWQYIILRNNTMEERIDFTRTAKQEKSCHGYGTQNIRSVVEKYGGEVTWKQEGKIVEVRLKFKVV